MWKTGALLLLLAALLAPRLAAAATDAASLGERLYRISLATATANEAIDDDEVVINGWLVEDHADLTKVRFFRQAGPGVVWELVGEADVSADGLRVLDKKILPAPIPASPGQLRLLRAEDKARSEIDGFTAFFPMIVTIGTGADSRILVYHFAPTRQEDPEVGQYFRHSFDSEGKLVQTWAFLEYGGPIEMTSRATPELSNPYSATPTEVEVYLSLAFHVPLLVHVSDGSTWRVDGTSITRVASPGVSR